MTRRRTFTFVLGVCIGFLLLLVGTAIAKTTEASTVVSEKPDSQKTSTLSRGTILTRVSSIHKNPTVTEKDRRNFDLTKEETHNNQDKSSGSSDESVSQSGKRRSEVSTAYNTSDATKSESSSDGNRKARYGEIAAKSSGKSTSTKVISDDFLRLSRTNELIAATTKSPTLNDSKQDNKRNVGNTTIEETFNNEEPNVTIPLSTKKENIVSDKLANIIKISETKHIEDIIPNEQETTTAILVENFSSLSAKLSEDEKKNKTVKSDYKETILKIESMKNKDVTLVDLKESDDRDRELTTVRDIQREDSQTLTRNVKDQGTTASEALDLGNIDEKGREGIISLINDTYVNYNHFYKTVTEKDAKADSRNRSIDTNSTRGKGDPKEEVEVVNNMAHQPILRIVTNENETAKNESHFNKPSNQDQTVYIKKKGGVKNENHFEQETDILLSNATISSADNTDERKSIRESESQVKLLEMTTQSIQLEEHSLGARESSPVPQGRTIGLSGVNEFSSTEVKFTTSAKLDDGASSITQSLQNNSDTEKIEQKPYPYLKSSRESLQTTTINLRANSDVAEEASSYKNTIGKEKSEKFVITEPSVVIENSIQQQKPEEKEDIKDSKNFTTKSLSSLIPATVIPIVSADVGSTNETLSEKLNGSAEAEMKSSTSKNDIPNTKEEEKVIASSSNSYDVTGNGITEVSFAPDRKGVKSHSSETTDSTSTSHSTEISNTSRIPLNTDVQMEPEEAMMIRSTFIVTESTMVPVDKAVAIEVNKSTTSAGEVNTVAATMVFENPTVSTSRTNVMQQSSLSPNQTTETLFTTLLPDASFIPTTTSVEFVFVGLTEAISVENNTTENNVHEQMTISKIAISPTVQDYSSATSNTTEDTVTTMKLQEFTELPVVTESGTDQVSTVYQSNNETIEESSTIQIVSQEQSNRTEFTRNKVAISVIDYTSVATAGTESSGVTEDPSESIKSSFNVNVTETSVLSMTELPNSDVTMKMPTTNITKNPLTPSDVTNILEPRVLSSTPTESPDEKTTDVVQILSSDEITLLVKIVIEGSLHEVCLRLPDLKKAFADVLTNGLKKCATLFRRLVLPEQIVIHQNPCLETTNSSPTPIDVSLTSILVYVVNEDRKFDVTMTKILPSLYKVSPNFPVRIHKVFLVPEADSGNAIAVVVVSSVAFICLVLLAGLLFIMRKRQTRFNYGERCRPVSLDAYSLDSVSAYNSVRRKGAARSSKRSYGNPTFEDSSAIPSHPLNFAGLSTFCNDINVINEEFAGIPQVSARIDELPQGAEVKNRYANVIPLPETRVPLQRLNNDPLTEYINASYVRGPKNATKYYIACQAPIESTVIDFWRMIWEQQCKVIIMLTDLVENGVEKCTEYIPPSEVIDCHRLYGDFQVTLKKRETKEKYAISTLHLKNLENNTFREIFHIWYLWPVSGVQSDGAGLIAVLLEARALQRGSPGPIVVHCSPGTGRTGTLIALDLGIRQYEITRTVDVPRVVYTIRRDRAGAVQTKEQYAFIYKALNLYATKLAGGVLEST
ncbi:mucin-3A isoform X2 [Pseudomyrmex gracilis]|uniref:mucin-3A isoform X2 n=1 Tax=Pseudomyrmex gracilis TaxID=219809 RepID=UPI000995A65F|nr:mucin-3A isoform X2 [Pseudomyrmex gracilis]